MKGPARHYFVCFSDLVLTYDLKIGKEAPALGDPAFVVFAAANIGSARIMVYVIGGEDLVERRDVSFIPALIQANKQFHVVFG
jgi:hypothetical protein